MSKDVLRMSAAVACAAVCLACPVVIEWLGSRYGYDRLPSDQDFEPWRVSAVGGLFGVALVATAGLIAAARRWWWLAALFALPLLGVTAALAVTCAAWLDGTYL